MSSFVDEIDAFIAKTEKRALAVYHGSAQDLAEEVIRPRQEGGHIPFVTGFLRGSFQGSLENLPAINPKAVPPTDAAPGSFGDRLGEINLVIAGATWDDTIYMGFTAAYARVQEYRYGFTRLAAQNWDTIVYTNALKAMQAYP